MKSKTSTIFVLYTSNQKILIDMYSVHLKKQQSLDSCYKLFIILNVTHLWATGGIRILPDFILRKALHFIFANFQIGVGIRWIPYNV